MFFFSYSLLHVCLWNQWTIVDGQSPLCTSPVHPRWPEGDGARPLESFVLASCRASCSATRFLLCKPPRWPSGQGIRRESGRSGVQIPLATGFLGFESYRWLKNGLWIALQQKKTKQPKTKTEDCCFYIRLDSANQKRGHWLPKGPNVRRSTLALVRLALILICIVHGLWLHPPPPPPNTLSDENINRGLVSAHIHSIARTQKIPTFMS